VWERCSQAFPLKSTECSLDINRHRPSVVKLLKQ